MSLARCTVLRQGSRGSRGLIGWDSLRNKSKDHYSEDIFDPFGGHFLLQLLFKLGNFLGLLWAS